MVSWNNCQLLSQEPDPSKLYFLHCHHSLPNHVNSTLPDSKKWYSFLLQFHPLTMHWNPFTQCLKSTCLLTSHRMVSYNNHSLLSKEVLHSFQKVCTVIAQSCNFRFYPDCAAAMLCINSCIFNICLFSSKPNVKLLECWLMLNHDSCSYMYIFEDSVRKILQDKRWLNTHVYSFKHGN